MVGIPALRAAPRFAFLILCLFARVVAGQAAAEGPVFVLEAYVVDQLGAESVLPTVRTTSAVMGIEKSVLDSPRAVSTITSGQLRDKNIRRVEDLDTFVSGAFSAPIFGNVGVPMLRGDLGETYQNGQRRAYNRNSYPISFNGVEAVEAVKGAVPALFGYGNATGGYLNLVTKQPWVEGNRTEARVTVGSWEHYRWQVDHGGPIDPQWSYRLSYEGVHAGSFYRLVEDRLTSVFAALSYRPEGNLSWALNLEYLDARFSEIPGINRPTQELIDRGWYLSGESISSGGSFFGNTFEPTGKVKVNGSEILLAPGDGAQAEVFNAQSTLTIDLEEGALVSRTLWESAQAMRHSSYYFFSYLPLSDTFDQRLEYARAFEVGGWEHEVVVGAAYRYERRRSFVDFLNEYFNAFDVTGDPETLRLPLDQLMWVLPVPGTSGFAVPGGSYPRADGSGRMTTSLSMTLDSRVHNLGVFAQDVVRLSEGWSILLGSRLDWLAISTRDPLPHPGFDPASARKSKGLWSGTVSLVAKPAPQTTWYLTLNQAAAVESSSGSGGFGMHGNVIRDEVLENSSQLVETGLKASVLENRLFSGLAAFYQRRNRSSPRGGLPDEIEIRGVEWDLVYQPSRACNFGLIGSWSQANYLDGPGSGTPSTAAPFDPSRPSSTFPLVERGNYRLPGLPRWVANGFFSYTAEAGWGLTGTARWQSGQNLDLDGLVRIRSQVRFDLGFFWRWRQVELRLDCLNVTDEFNWRPTLTPFAGADLVTRELPRHYQATLVVRF